MVYQPFVPFLQQYKLADFRDLGFVHKKFLRNSTVSINIFRSIQQFRANEIFLCPLLL